MATSQQTDPKKLPQYPGNRQPQVPQPGQFVPASPGQPAAQAPHSITPPRGSVAHHVNVPPVAAGSYIDPILMREGAFTDRADYERTSKHIAARIRRGAILPRISDGE